MEEPCREIQELLPLLANGTLEDREKVSVYRHLAECGICRQELVFILAIAKTCKQESMYEISHKTAALLLHRIMEGIHKNTTESADRMENTARSLVNRVQQDLSPIGIVSAVFSTVTSVFTEEAGRINRKLRPALELILSV
jgi:predicted anti-sigma-YlaC factor YlaD